MEEYKVGEVFQFGKIEVRGSYKQLYQMFLIKLCVLLIMYWRM